MHNLHRGLAASGRRAARQFRWRERRRACRSRSRVGVKAAHDGRIAELRRAAEALAAGDTRIQAPVGADDVGRIGESLVHVAGELSERLERVVALVRLTEGVNAAVTLDDALEFLYYSFRALIPYDRISCALVVEQGRSLRAVWVRSRRTRSLLDVGYEMPLEGGTLRDVLASGEPRVINDLEGYLLVNPHSDSTRRLVEEGTRSSLTCPLVAMGRPIGCLFFSSSTKYAYRDEHVAYYQQISRVIGSVVERTLLYEEVSRARDELEVANSRLRTLVDVDGLTLIPNRRAFDRYLQGAWSSAVLTRTPLSILMVDVDYFKAFNDAYGHLAGDDCLRRIAGALAGSLLRAGDFVARFGGEEFAIVLPNTPHGQLPTVAERCLQQVRALDIRHEFSHVASVVTLSIGGVTWDPRCDVEPTEVLRRADEALYAAKERGRNQFVLQPFLPEAHSC